MRLGVSLRGPRKCRAPLPRGEGRCGQTVGQSGGAGRTRETCSPACKRRLTRERAAELEATARSRSVEWYTPAEVLHWFAERWGPFTIDPCATPRSPVWPLIPIHISAEEGGDGLAEPWDTVPFLTHGLFRRGRAFVNPPYGRTDLPAWSSRAWRAVHEGEVELAAMLVPLRPSSAWFRFSLERGATFEPLPKRVRFHELRADGSVGPCSGALFECTALVFGDRPASPNRSAP